MRALVQRVSRASVWVNSKENSSIKLGIVILLAIGKDDSVADVDYIVEKVANLRIFPDATGKFDQSAIDIKAELLLVSQFTLYADTRRGRRPSFSNAAPAHFANELFQKTINQFRNLNLITRTGIFQETMSVELVNEGPVTIWIDSKDKDMPRKSA